MQRPLNPAAHSRPAFSLVELMIVIVIIGLLVGILVPVLSKAYKTAMASADSALLAQISMGCEAYQQAFHEYPNSSWSPAFPATGTNIPLQMSLGWPPPTVPAGGGAGYIATVPVLSGAAKVYASLSGFNTLADSAGLGGCNSIPAGNWDPYAWQGRCGELTHRGILTANVPGTASEDKIYGPYYVPAQKQETATRSEWQGLAPTDQTVFASRFSRPGPGQLVVGGQETGAPILYYRARAIPTDSDANGQIDPWEIYDYHDNYLITDPARAAIKDDPYDLKYQAAGSNLPNFKWHPLYGSVSGQRDVDSLIPNANPGMDFGILRPVSPGPNTPLTVYNADTYILISPGPDGIYFTADDITNFKQ